MIFVVTGSRQYPFDRLIEGIDQLFAEKVIAEPVFAQIGNARYVPRHFSFTNFITQQEFLEKINEADLVITHAASGTVMKALRADKKVIVVPRQRKYGEHIDDHQIQAARAYSDHGYALAVFDMVNLGETINKIKEGNIELRRWENKDPLSIANLIDGFIAQTWDEKNSNKASLKRGAKK